MSKACMGARVMFCGHDGWFEADIHEVAGTNVVRANGPVDGATLRRGCNEEATHHVSDFPKSGYWGARLGVLVVPKNQVKELRKIIRYKVKSTEKKR